MAIDLKSRDGTGVTRMPESTKMESTAPTT
jgi:hypothetical protein